MKHFPYFLSILMLSLFQSCFYNAEPGTYGYDAEFLIKHGIETLELVSDDGRSKVLIAPQYQGRVMTSTAGGDEGRSFGWINYDLIQSGNINEQFNPVGGEERLWLGPEGGPFSIYFPQGVEQQFENWRVPAQLDTEPFDLVRSDDLGVEFKKEFEVTNALGTKMMVDINRKVRLLGKESVASFLSLSLPKELDVVAFESINILTNAGSDDWSEEGGFLSIWMLCMFSPSEQGVVFIPIIEQLDGTKIVSDDYFGKVPDDRLRIKDGIVFFKVDGKKRSKIGVTPGSAVYYACGYDPVNQTLTVVWYSKPQSDRSYVNSLWGKQDNPLNGDVINSYNDGPTEDGAVMGPFYEIETSSPAAILRSNESMIHIQRVMHFGGSRAKLNAITTTLFSLDLNTIEQAFK